MSRAMTCHYCGGLHGGDKCTKSDDEKARRDRQDDLAIDLEDDLLSVPALDIIEAVLAGASISKEVTHEQEVHSATDPTPTGAEWETQWWRVTLSNRKTCPTCK